MIHLLNPRNHVWMPFLLVLYACTMNPKERNQQPESDSLKTDIQSSVEHLSIDSIDLDRTGAEVAATFINSYVKYVDELAVKGETNFESEVIKWISASPLLTDSFKTSYKDMVEAARRSDPELGLDFDPILDAQDSPNSCKVLDYSEDGFVTLQGIDWQNFTLTVRLVHFNNHWLVDGSGVINVPQDKQRKD